MTLFITERLAVDFTPLTPRQKVSAVVEGAKKIDGGALLLGALAGGIAALVGADAGMSAAIGSAMGGKPPDASIFTPNREVIVHSDDPVPDDVRQQTQALNTAARLQSLDPRGDRLVAILLEQGYSVTGNVRSGAAEHWRLEKS